MAISTNCPCPKPVSLTAISATTCPVQLKRIFRAWFVRKDQVVWDTATPANNLPASIVGEVPEDDIGWITLIGLATADKVVTAPVFGGDITITEGDKISFGGGDASTLTGEEVVMGAFPAPFTATYHQLSAAQVAEIRLLQCEDLEVYFTTQANKIIAKRTGDLITGFCIESFYLGSKVTDGLLTPDSNSISFMLEKDWDEKFEVLDATFNTTTF